jgi:hypothetical protein
MRAIYLIAAVVFVAIAVFCYFRLGSMLGAFILLSASTYCFYETYKQTPAPPT